MDQADLQALLQLLRANGVRHYQTPDLQIVFGALPLPPADDPGIAGHDIVPGLSDGDGEDGEDEDISLLERLRNANAQKKAR